MTIIDSGLLFGPPCI